MNLTELRVARIRRGVKAQELADAIDRTVDSYIKRENGNVRVTLSDAFTITQVLQLSLEEFVVIFLTETYLFQKITMKIIISVSFRSPSKKRGRESGTARKKLL